MSSKELTLPPNADPILPSQHRTEINRYIHTNQEYLSGIDSAAEDTLFSQANENSLNIQDRPDGDPVLVSDCLRVRADDTLALHPIVCQVVTQNHHDQLLDDLVDAHYGRFIDNGVDPRSIEPIPTFPEPVLDGLNEDFNLAYRRPKFELSAVENCDGNNKHNFNDYPIQIQDILADLRMEGIVTNLAKSDCEKCGHENGIKLADKLRNEGKTVHGYAGVAANSPPGEPLISVQDCDESSWNCRDVVDEVLDSAHAHEFRSNIRVRKAGILRQSSGQ